MSQPRHLERPQGGGGSVVCDVHGLRFWLAILRPDLFRGAIVECGHMGPWREVGRRAKPDSSFYLFTRSDDFNQPATHKLHHAMYDARCRVKLEERAGGHAPMMPDEVGPALAWLASV